ncbi:uncharacterized protein LOC101769353 [Setaria italica]|uniref:uncharacterized protein LOC101769353 n=1 Tax=Setaria italica TaxID=4555 RepID=UPI000350C37A|nr:uncharacterized protein LOC101769353 [Setaria italica]
MAELQKWLDERLAHQEERQFAWLEQVAQRTDQNMNIVLTTISTILNQLHQHQKEDHVVETAIDPDDREVSTAATPDDPGLTTSQAKDDPGLTTLQAREDPAVAPAPGLATSEGSPTPAPGLATLEGSPAPAPGRTMSEGSAPPALAAATLEGSAALATAPTTSEGCAAPATAAAPPPNNHVSLALDDPLLSTNPATLAHSLNPNDKEVLTIADLMEFVPELDESYNWSGTNGLQNDQADRMACRLQVADEARSSKFSRGVEDSDFQVFESTEWIKIMDTCRNTGVEGSSLPPPKKETSPTSPSCNE